MPIHSPEELKRMLQSTCRRSLSDGDIEVLEDTAIFQRGLLAGLYLKPMQKCAFDEMNNFYRMAGVHMRGMGDRAGGVVYADYYPTGVHPPCVPKDGWSCWVAAKTPWRP